jgi:hypothetical protein
MVRRILVMLATGSAACPPRSETCGTTSPDWASAGRSPWARISAAMTDQFVLARAVALGGLP